MDEISLLSIILKVWTLSACMTNVLTNDCYTQHKGSCVSYLTSNCLKGEHHTFIGCGFGEMCCFPTTPIPQAPVYQPNQCGLSTPQTKHTNKIVGGSVAKPGEFPWQIRVSIRFYGMHLCGGILIDRHWVLTAAGCFEQSHNPQMLTAVVGENDRLVTEGHEKTIKIDAIFDHSHYDHNNYNNDIAMVKLADAVEINGYVRPACLPHKTDNFVNQTCVITGWGATQAGGYGTHLLYKANITVFAQDDCANLLNVTIPDTMLCAGTDQGGIDGCQGDGGGPLVCESGGVYTIAGIVSWGYSCALNDIPGVYTNVPKYIDWIKSVLNAYDPSSTILGKRGA